MTTKLMRNLPTESQLCYKQNVGFNTTTIDTYRKNKYLFYGIYIFTFLNNLCHKIKKKGEKKNMYGQSTTLNKTKLCLESSFIKRLVI